MPRRMKSSTMQTIEGRWDQVAGQVKQTWGKVTDNDLTRVRGKATELVGVIKEKTGESREAIERRLDQITEKLPGR